MAPLFLALLAGLALAACTRSPASWKEWIDQATPAFKAQQFDAAFERCRKAYDYAVADKKGPQALAALECMAESSTRQGKPELAFPFYQAVLRDYDASVREASAGLRLRNNYGVALVQAGEKAQGVKVLEEALDAYEGTPQHSRENYRARMLLVTNLARAVRVFADSETGIRVSTDILAEILNYLENARFRNQEASTLGTGDALAAIAELVRIRGDVRLAAELAGQAKEQLAIEASLSDEIRRPPCDYVALRSLTFRPCWVQLGLG